MCGAAAEVSYRSNKESASYERKNRWLGVGAEGQGSCVAGKQQR